MTGLSHQPRSTATAAAATDDEPEALVSPAPRSQTSTVRSCRAVDANELDVRPLREPGVRLDQRAEPQQVVPRRIVEADHRVRIADRCRRQLDPVHRLDGADGDLAHVRVAPRAR